MLPVGKFVRVGELRTDPGNGIVHRYDGKEWISTVQEETVQDAPGEAEGDSEVVIPAETSEDAVKDVGEDVIPSETAEDAADDGKDVVEDEAPVAVPA